MIIMADEKVFTIPLRDAYNSERVMRSKKAITIVREYLQRHMKAEDVNIGKSINEAVWMRGAKKPARRVKVHAVLEDKVVYSEVVGTDIKTPTAEDKKKKDEKAVAKEKKIKEERKERKSQTIQEELEAGADQKKGPQEEVAEKLEEKKETKMAEPGDQTERKDKAISRKTGKG